MTGPVELWTDLRFAPLVRRVTDPKYHEKVPVQLQGGGGGSHGQRLPLVPLVLDAWDGWISVFGGLIVVAQTIARFPSSG